MKKSLRRARRPRSAEEVNAECLYLMELMELGDKHKGPVHSSAPSKKGGGQVHKNGCGPKLPHRL